MKPLFIFFCAPFLLTLFSCAYDFQGRSNPWLNRGIEKVYVQTLANNSLRPGIETIFTGALVKEFSRGKRLRMVSDPDDADAIIAGSVDSVGSAISQETTVPQIAPDDPQAIHFSNIVIATEYVSSATITVRMIQQKNKAVLWTQSFTQSKLFPGNNRLGASGNTSMLINDSQHQMALSEISTSLANDAYDALCEAF